MVGPRGPAYAALVGALSPFSQPRAGQGVTELLARPRQDLADARGGGAERLPGLLVPEAGAVKERDVERLPLGERVDRAGDDRALLLVRGALLGRLLLGRDLPRALVDLAVRPLAPGPPLLEDARRDPPRDHR